MSSEFPEVDFSELSHGEHSRSAVLREAYAKAAEFRREHGLPEPSKDRLYGIPIILDETDLILTGWNE